MKAIEGVNQPWVHVDGKKRNGSYVRGENSRETRDNGSGRY